MSREVLLTLLGVLLLINVGVLVSIAILATRHRASSTRAEAPPGTATPPDAHPSRDGATATPPIPADATGSRPSSRTPPTSLPDRAGVVALATRTYSADAVVPGTTRLPLLPAGPSNGGQNGTAHETPASRRAPAGRRAERPRRQRRFVLPPLEEDDGRSARAIEAFLGHPPDAGRPQDRPPRRRHRARRPAGARSQRVSLVVAIDGFAELERSVGSARAARLAAAFGDALWRAARTGDELRDLGAGRYRVTLECDPAGADAYVERARASVGPWLSAIGVPLAVSARHEPSVSDATPDGDASSPRT